MLAVSRRRRLVVVGGVVLGVAYLLGPFGCGRHSGPRERGARARDDGLTGPAGYALVYGRVIPTKRVQIIWQDLQSGRSRVVYTSVETEANLCIPDDLGWLPSPDGRWLYVWDTVDDEHGLSKSRRLLLVSLAQGRRVSIGELRDDARVLPHWASNRRLTLETDHQSTEFDVSRSTVAGPLPQWTPPVHDSGASLEQWRAWEQALVGYCTRHYARERECLLSALRRLEPQLRVAVYLEVRDYPEPDLPDFLLLRSLGVVELAGPTSTKLLYPTVVCSPNGKLVARAGLAVVERVASGNEAGQRETRGLVEARVDVFDSASGGRLWGTELPWRGSTRVRADGELDPPVLHVPDFLLPHFRDLRWSGDGRFLSFTAYDQPPPPGLPFLERSRRVVVWGEGAPRWGYPWETATVVVDTSWWTGHATPWRYLYVVNALNGFVIPAAS